ncbi:MAG: CRISPR-associated endonuclease/helicase Cas3 [Actinomycetota bacterium]|nr:CRISPR-associated endonuclease/helicase Cas3 [Actinomycetota bacterium]
MKPRGPRRITFDDFCRMAVDARSSFHPYPYQQLLAQGGLPDLLRVPTGTGKTLAAVLPWMFRRRVHPDPEVREATPRWLVVVLPQRSLVEQTFTFVTTWLANLEKSDPSGRWGEVGHHLLLGGSSTDDRAWKHRPTADAVFVGTQDMVLSRLLLRGYGESRSVWPMSFGLLHANTQFVFDEVQLMGPGLPTSLQLEGLRRVIGTAMSCRTMWMSATIKPSDFEQVPDLAGFWESARVVELGGSDRENPDLSRRLVATRTVSRLDVSAKSYCRDLAAAVVREHRPGTRTIVVVNTVDRALAVHQQVQRSAGQARVVLLHSRFRLPEREARMNEALEEVPEAGTIVVSTQVLEAGVDVSSALLVSELAPWSSMVQRAGRCNRAGEEPGAKMLWVRPHDKRPELPYTVQQLDLAEQVLVSLDGQGVTNVQLQAVQVDEPAPVHPVLRRRDLVDLFDTLPDLSGNDMDVSRWIRDADDRTVSVAWWALNGQPPGEKAKSPFREELCSVPVGKLKDLLKEHATAGRRALSHAWVRDRPSPTERRRGVSDRPWTTVPVTAIRPGSMVVLDADAGGYDVTTGWHGKPNGAVPVVERPAETSPPTPPSRTTPSGTTPDDAPGDPFGGVEETDERGGDPLSASERPVTLAQHLEDVEREATSLLDRYGATTGLSDDLRQAAVTAAALHDIGKAHPVFADSLERAGAPHDGGPWAKSGTDAVLRHSRPAFRHELVSALMLLSPDSGLLDDVVERDLVVYLVAAHHGKVRLGVRSAPEEHPGYVLGVAPDDVAPALKLPDGRMLPSMPLPREIIGIGEGSDTTEQVPSWTTRTCALRDRPDLGVFRLGFLEALVRSADWKISEGYGPPRPATSTTGEGARG